MTRQKSFQTAAGRRRQDPIIWNIDGTEINLRPSVDLAEIAPLVEELQAPIPDGANQVEAAVSKRAAMVKTVRTFIDEASRQAFDKVAPDIDMPMLTEMVQDLIAEYAGTANPTKPSSSSDGSPETGPSSTDGAPQEESMPSA